MSRFAFLIHPRDRSDIEHYGALNAKERERACREVVSIVVGEVNFAGVTGQVIALPLTTAQMARLPRRYVREHVAQAMRLAERNGARVVGLGAMTSVVTRAGQTLTDQARCIVTNGNALTAAVVARQVQEAANAHRVPPRIGLIGGAGSVGFCVAQLLECGYRELVLVGRSPASLNHAQRTLRAMPGRRCVTTARSAAQVTDADVILVATAGPEFVLDLRDLTPGTTVLDVSEPSNVTGRPSVSTPSGPRLIRAGIVQLGGVDISSLVPGLPTGQIFACLAETILCAMDDSELEHSVGQPTPARAEAMAALATTMGMQVST